MRILSSLLLAGFLCVFTVGCKKEIGEDNPNPAPDPGAHAEETGDEADAKGTPIE